MNGNAKNAIYLILPVVTILPLILFASDYIYFQEPLSRVGLYPDDPKCDRDCVDKMSDGYRCAEVKKGEFVCRKERGYSLGDREILFHSAGPISYGEIASIPVGKSDDVMFKVTNIRIVDRDSETILADFIGFQENYDTLVPVYTAELKPDDTFLQCSNPWLTGHLVLYSGLYEHEGTTYAEFWGLHPYVPPELFPCELPKMYERSLRTDYEIILPKYEEFGFG